MIPENQKQHNDLIDIVIEASQKIQEEDQVDGTRKKMLVLDPKKVWWKTGSVNSPYLGRLALEIEEFERLADDCYDNMDEHRAASIAKDILAIGDNYRYSIDAKSSESIRDRHNTQQTLIDKINKNKIEKAYTVKGEAKRSLFDGFLGREEEKDDY